MDIELLIEQLIGQDPVAGNDALQSLLAQGSSCIESVVQKLGEKANHPQARFRLARFFEAFGEASAKPLLGVLQQGLWPDCLVAAECFKGLRQQSVVDSVEWLIGDSKPQVQQAAMEALGHMGAISCIKNISFMAGFSDSAEEIENSIRTLTLMLAAQSMDQDIEAALRTFERCLTRIWEHPRYGDVEKYWKTITDSLRGCRALMAEPVIRTWLFHESPLFRLLASVILRKLRLRETAGVLSERMFDPDEELGVRIASVEALGDIESADSFHSLMQAFETIKDNDTEFADFRHLPRSIVRALSMHLHQCRNLKEVSLVLDRIGNPQEFAFATYTLGLRKKPHDFVAMAFDEPHLLTKAAAAVSATRIAGPDALGLVSAVYSIWHEPLEQALICAAQVHARINVGAELHSILCEAPDSGLGWHYLWKREFLYCLSACGNTLALAAWSDYWRIDAKQALSEMKNILETTL